MIQHLTKFLVGVVLIFVLFEHPLLAQQSTATLTGSVTDSSGKLLPDVKIFCQERGHRGDDCDRDRLRGTIQLDQPRGCRTKFR
jgi:hypothetical protein